MSTERPALFSDAWWDLVLAAWNASGEAASLARFGLASFQVSDAASPPVWVHWDAAGQAARRGAGTRDCPQFAASEANWRALMAGRFGVGMGVLRLKITFRGQVRRVLPYTGGLNALARVARPFA
ncbi:MAG: hypothetical protein SF182_01775 [Deltaproteobacteria bacterium]|nr:hypothetical protein [Deltaproteobacteria bacterium]